MAEMAEVVQDIEVPSKRVINKRVNEADPLKKLLPRQRKFLKFFLQSKNRVQAWRKSHPNCSNDASAMASATHFLSHNPEVMDWVYQLAGLGDDDFIKVVRDSMSATRQTIYKGTAFVEPDPYARLKAVELGMKMRGKDQPKATGNTMNIQIINDEKTGTFKIIEGEEV